DALRHEACLQPWWGRPIYLGRGGATLDGLAANRDARAHRYSNGNDALSPLKASRRSVFWQRTHSNLRCSYPAALMAKSCSTCTMRISAPHEMQRISMLPVVR